MSSKANFENSSPQTAITVALAGNPNAGKTTLFNALTGLHQKVANYSGVTVERKEGVWNIGETKVHLIDLPGLYSLDAASLDEQIARDVLLGKVEELPTGHKEKCADCGEYFWVAEPVIDSEEKDDTTIDAFLAEIHAALKPLAERANRYFAEANDNEVAEV